LMRPDHPIVVIRIVLILLCAVPAASRLFHSISDPRLPLLLFCFIRSDPFVFPC
jgi:hypothetical protein